MSCLFVYIYYVLLLGWLCEQTEECDLVVPSVIHLQWSYMNVIEVIPESNSGLDVVGDLSRKQPELLA